MQRPSLQALHLFLLSACLAACMASGTTDPSTTTPVRASETTSRGERPPAIEPASRPVDGSVVEPPAVHRAVRIALTPLSSVRPTAGSGRAIDLRVDAFDASGARTRMAGDVRVVLRAKGCDPLYSAFDLPLRTRSQEAKHWDQTLEQYVLRIEPAWTVPPAEGARIDVTVTLSPGSGPNLEATGPIEWRVGS